MVQTYEVQSPFQSLMLFVLMTHLLPPLNDCRSYYISLVFPSLYFISSGDCKKVKFQDNSNTFPVLEVQNKKAELIKGHASPTRPSSTKKDPPLSVPPSQEVWLYRDYICLDFSLFGRPLKYL